VRAGCRSFYPFPCYNNIATIVYKIVTRTSPPPENLFKKKRPYSKEKNKIICFKYKIKNSTFALENIWQQNNLFLIV